MSSVLKRAEEFVTELFRTKIPPDLKYHNLEHTQDVVETAEDVGRKSGLNDEELEMLLLAAWFHDAGFAEKYEGHENESIKICTDFLRHIHYPEEKIEKVVSIIAATVVGKKPTNLVEKVIKDADLSHTGKKWFFEVSAGLRYEWLKFRGKEFTDEEWIQINADFLSSTVFYTPYAKEIFNDRKEKNLNKLKKLLVNT